MSTAFANRITSLRKEKGLSQKEVAISLGVSQALLSHYEKGVRECGLDFVVSCADYFGVTTDYLLGRQDSKYGLINEEEKYLLLETATDEIDMQLVMLCVSFFAEKVKRPMDEVYGDKLMWSAAIALYKLVVYGVNRGQLQKEWFDVEMRNDDFVFQKFVDIIWNGLYVNDTQVVGEIDEQYGKQFPEVFSTLIQSVESYVEKITARYLTTANEKINELQEK
ncbi:MAG: helix-turn-helix transcriptional regulator [Clostridia bacterium]|nr:helix-turn-helix transcriptional regulator [Clostridia bacterium]MBR6634532.1 helix-turn-helix transcriptional regulator [Clostridia bacterium]